MTRMHPLGMATLMVHHRTEVTVVLTDMVTKLYVATPIASRSTFGMAHV